MPFNAAEIQEQIRKKERAYINKACLIYGAPKVGKTRLAATIAQVPSIEKVIWLDTERGSDTIFSGQTTLTAEEMGKIIPIFFQDTTDAPTVAITLLQALTSQGTVHIDQENGIIKPGAKPSTVPFSFKTYGPETAIVYDTISQVGDSVFNLQKTLYKYTDNRKYWGCFYQDMNAITSAIQSSRAYNIMLAQEQVVEGTTSDEERKHKVNNPTDRTTTSKIMVMDDKMLPVCGSQPYASKLAKYPSTVVRLYIERKHYSQISKPTAMANVLAGSRLGIDVAPIKDPTMAQILGISK